jgi:DNA-binding winged helix-turn-helix (wHTH) protein/tetratricopeptide (TPR) repeat protein
MVTGRMRVDRSRTGDEAARPIVRYRFGAVTLEVREQRLLVHGRERRLARHPFELLLALCRSPRRVLSREELHATLWPGGQIGSDEALTQTLFRLRAALGEEAERIVTLRGVGVRLDAEVICETETAEAAPRTAVPVAAPASAPRASSGRPRRRRRVAFALGALLGVVLLAAARIVLAPRAEPMVDAGYGIAPADVHAARPDTTRLLAEAIRYDNEGDRPRARALLEALHDGDTRSPWPALLLGLWSVGAGDPHVAAAWLTRARQRVEPLRDVYLNAMLRYAEAEQAGSAEDIIRHAGAVLDLHGGAWRMRLARAHLRNYQGLREAALAEISRIQVRELGDRKLESALADRASYGDVAGARAALQALPRTTDAAAWEYLAGRIAWSQGDRAAAREAWQRAVEEAKRNGRRDIGARAQADAGLAAMLDGDAEAAIAHFERARMGMAEARAVKDEVDVTLLLAQLRARAGDAEAARREFERAVAACERDSGGAMMRMHTVLVGARLFPDRTTGLRLDPKSPAQALLDARLAFARGDAAAARQALTVAEQRGALDGTLADETRLLAAELGLPVAPERPIDPPYAPRSGVFPRLLLPGRAAADH